jgi:histidinol phosphatase-like enzyme (inositol monophosphatase family)
MSDTPSGPTKADIASRWEAAQSLSQLAGRLTLDYFQRGSYDVERKSDDSPVTAADRGAERLMREEIEQRFPQDAIVGEEFGEQTGSSGYTWILDPIDGTKSFISGVPLYSVLVGVTYERTSVVGVILLPALGECVHAASGHGAWWNRGDDEPAAARVSSCRPLSEGLFVTSQVDSFGECNAGEAYRQLERAAYITRTWGDGYGYLLVATGRAVAMVDPVMNVWDAAALQPILTEAGGTFTDWQGEATIHSGNGVATNGHVLEEVLRITRRFPPSSPPSGG